MTADICTPTSDIEALYKEDTELILKRNQVAEEAAKINTRRREIAEKVAELRWGVKRGARVSSFGKEFVVLMVDGRMGAIDKPWVIANPVKKDGSVGTSLRNLYAQWELVQ